MAVKKAEMQDRAARGKRLLRYGLYVVVLVAFAVAFGVSWVALAPLGKVGLVILYAVLAAVGAAILAVIVWYIYVKFILKE